MNPKLKMCLGSLAASLFAFAAISYLSGCNLVTVPNPQTGKGHTADHVIINEVFTLPDSQYDDYSWIEIFNPTNERIPGFNKWSIRYIAVVKKGSGSSDTATLRARLISFVGDIPDTLEAGRMLVLAGDSASLMEHTNLGQAPGAMVEFFPLRFPLAETGQIALLDTSGNVVDLVRYGNYVPPPPDAYPGNKSAGMIPEWYSLSRYAYAYSTGNSADDFYMAKTPTPLWYSERAHP